MRTYKTKIKNLSKRLNKKTGENETIIVRVMDYSTGEYKTVKLIKNEA